MPTVTARAGVAAKSETSNFAVAQPTLGQFTLSAFAAGLEVPCSLELAEDAPLFQDAVLDDAVSGFLEYEENLFINGSGSGQAQGLLGNVGSGVTDEPDTNGNPVSILATWNVLSTVKASYQKGASWLMQQNTAIAIRKAQVGSNLFEPVFRRENGIDLLHGFPVAYSSQMPAAARGNCAALFGNFAQGYVIGDRGGPALILKVLNQAGMQQGIVNLLFYRRVDGRVRAAEAIQSLTIAAS